MRLAARSLPDTVALILGCLVALETGYFVCQTMLLSAKGELTSGQWRDRTEAAYARRMMHRSPKWMDISPRFRILLATFLALLSWLIGLPSHGGLLFQWLGTPLSTSTVEYLVRGSGWIGYCLSFALTVIGVWFAYELHATGRISRVALQRRCKQRFAILNDLSTHGWYVEAIYRKWVTGPISKLAYRLWVWVDVGIIDGSINGLAYLSNVFSQRLRKLQTGVVSHYAFAIVITTVLILGLLLNLRGSH